MLLLPSTQLLLSISFLHRDFHKIWLGYKVEFFEGGSTLLRQILHNTRLSFVFVVVFCLYQH